MLRAACAGTKAISPASSSVYYGQSWIPNSTRLKPLLHMHWYKHKCLDFLKLFRKLELHEQQVGQKMATLLPGGLVAHYKYQSMN